jgi:hypothetical protein
MGLLLDRLCGEHLAVNILDVLDVFVEELLVLSRPTSATPSGPKGAQGVDYTHSSDETACVPWVGAAWLGVAVAVGCGSYMVPLPGQRSSWLRDNRETYR